jgi:hypothetical protein
VRAGTGKLTVIRSWVGTNPGNQGAGWYVTRRAARRLDQHEQLHVRNTRTNYNTHLQPLLLRVARHTGARKGVRGPTAPGAVAALQAIIKWPTSVSAFQTADTAANTPGGTVDTTDLATGTYPVDAGPGTVRGAAYLHRVRLPSEPNPPA